MEQQVPLIVHRRRKPFGPSGHPNELTRGIFLRWPRFGAVIVQLKVKTIWPSHLTDVILNKDDHIYVLFHVWIDGPGEPAVFGPNSISKRWPRDEEELWLLQSPSVKTDAFGLQIEAYPSDQCSTMSIPMGNGFQEFLSHLDSTGAFVNRHRE